MKLLLAYLRPYRGMIALALGLAVVNQVFSLLDPQIFRIIIDRYATDVSAIPRAEFFRGVGLLILAFIGVAMVSRIAKNFQDYYVNVVSQSVGANLYADGIAHSLRLPYRTFEDRQSGAVLQQLQKARTDSRDLIGQAVNTVFISSFTFLLVLAYAFVVHWTIGAGLLVLSPILGVLVSALGRRIKAVQARIFAETNALAGSTTESLRNIELIKSLGLETQEIDRLNRTNTRILGLELAKVKTVRLLMFAQGTAINFFRALLLAGMLALMYFKLITLGEFFSMMFYSFAIFSPLGELGTIITRWQETRASLANVERLLAEEPAPGQPRRRAARARCEHRLRGRHLPAPVGTRAGAAGRVVLGRFGREHRLRRPVGRRQEHAGEAAARSLPARLRFGPLQRHRLPGDRLRRPASTGGVRTPVHRAVRGHHP